MSDEICPTNCVPEASDVLLPNTSEDIEVWIARLRKSLHPLASAYEADLFRLERRKCSLQEMRVPNGTVIDHDQNIGIDCGKGTNDLLTLVRHIGVEYFNLSNYFACAETVLLLVSCRACFDGRPNGQDGGLDLLLCFGRVCRDNEFSRAIDEDRCHHLPM